MIEKSVRVYRQEALNIARRTRDGRWADSRQWGGYNIVDLPVAEFRVVELECIDGGPVQGRVYVFAE